MTTDQREQRTDDTAFEPSTPASDLRAVCDIYADFLAGLDMSQWDARTRSRREWTLHETIAHLVLSTVPA